MIVRFFLRLVIFLSNWFVFNVSDGLLKVMVLFNEFLLDFMVKDLIVVM